MSLTRPQEHGAIPTPGGPQTQLTRGRVLGFRVAASWHVPMGPESGRGCPRAPTGAPGRATLQPQPTWRWGPPSGARAAHGLPRPREAASSGPSPFWLTEGQAVTRWCRDFVRARKETVTGATVLTGVRLIPPSWETHAFEVGERGSQCCGERPGQWPGNRGAWATRVAAHTGPEVAARPRAAADPGGTPRCSVTGSPVGRQAGQLGSRHFVQVWSAGQRPRSPHARIWDVV